MTDSIKANNSRKTRDLKRKSILQKPEANSSRNPTPTAGNRGITQNSCSSRWIPSSCSRPAYLDKHIRRVKANGSVSPSTGRLLLPSTSLLLRHTGVAAGVPRPPYAFS